jgi:hypothetical protein
VDDADRSSRSYRIEYWIAVGAAAVLAGLAVLSAQSEVIGIERPLLGWIAVGTAVIGVVAAALPNIRQPPKKGTPPVGEPKPPGPDLSEE